MNPAVLANPCPAFGLIKARVKYRTIVFISTHTYNVSPWEEILYNTKIKKKRYHPPVGQSVAIIHINT